MDGTLYDAKGKAIAYIEHENETVIYLWSGHVVANLMGDLVYGWNGYQLGWFVEGVLYDLHGSASARSATAARAPCSRCGLTARSAHIPPSTSARPSTNGPTSAPVTATRILRNF